MLSFRKREEICWKVINEDFLLFLEKEKRLKKKYFLTGRTIYLFSLLRVWEEKSWLESIHVFSCVVHCRLKFCTDHCRDRNCQESFSPSEEIEEGRKKKSVVCTSSERQSSQKIYKRHLCAHEVDGRIDTLVGHLGPFELPRA